MNRLIAFSLVGVLALAAACGSGSDSSSASAPARTIAVSMVDTRYEPASVDVEQGETVRFVFTNKGKVDHDAFIGDADAQKGHEEEMADMADMHHDGDDDAITVKPGKTGTLTHTFDDAGEVIIGCHQPGHYASGMRLRVTVTAS